jgi:diguanylate cyclase (GGDEF)-like protein
VSGSAVKAENELDQLRRRVHELEQLARTDALTGLYNRRHMEEELTALSSAARRQGTPLGMLLVDVDHFKRINDRLSYQAGDKALQSVADRIRSLVRAEDVVGRWGGDEFVVLLPSSDLDAALVLGRRLRVEAAGSVNGDGPALPVTVSIGCAATYQPEGPALIAAADAALHRAKGRGRNRVSV